MRFKWRRHLVVTAFAAASMLPFAGCSSQQQQVTDEVAAEGQEGVDEEGGDETVATQEGGGDETAGTQEGSGNETAAVGQGVENPAAESQMGSENLAGNPSGMTDPAANGDLKNIISEMNGSQGAQAANSAPSEGVIAEATPPDPSALKPEEAVAMPEPVASSTTTVTSPVVGSLPEMGSKMAYVVESGDTLAKIAVKIYGDQKRWRDIAGLSGIDNPNHIYPGDLVYYTLDEQSQNFAQNQDNLKRGHETVRSGDTLASISKRVYGTSKLWKHIWRQNDHIDNPDKLIVGMSVFYVEKNGATTAQVKGKNSDLTQKYTAKTKNIVSYAKTGVVKQTLAAIAASV